ncbi:hypothetical protein [Alteromonas oceanisediminis]|uniref:hypothetical protein n=1 Tax=Alteromonas oceanisediminis TaxID=2836180 RepID=UPI001BDB2451|nr:hypothetical protein [Alteromonas oceanisediminis]MBT0586694.1 hypothetical protein [Alteromonas oceanisediminis]
MKRYLLPGYEATERAFEQCQTQKCEAQVKQTDAVQQMKHLIASPKGMGAIAAIGAANEFASSDTSRTKPALTLLRIITLQWLT